jgi:hypothetical protein
MPVVPESIAPLLERVRAAATAAGVFDRVEVRDGTLVCRARGAAAPASYRVLADAGRVWVALVTADRWLSESIEADLMHTGDKIVDLLDEELVDQGLPSDPRPCEHFRSDDLLFTFRTAIPLPGDVAGSPQAVRVITSWLLAYEAAFRNLGDMQGGEGD